jgi:hypothetical protein
MHNFIQVCLSISTLIGFMGRATRFATSTVNGYVENISLRMKKHELSKTTSVRDLLQFEVDSGDALSGKKDPSISRCVLRLLWFLDFVEAIIRYCCVDSDDDETSVGATRAYVETIGSRHPWIFRKGAVAALHLSPRRRIFLTSLQVRDVHGEVSEDEALRRLREMHVPLLAVLVSLSPLASSTDSHIQRRSLSTIR